jgi:hypothetical protein
MAGLQACARRLEPTASQPNRQWPSSLPPVRSRLCRSRETRPIAHGPLRRKGVTMLLPYQYRQPPHTNFSTSRRGSTTVGKHGFFGRRYGASYHVVVEQVAYVDDDPPAIGDPLPTTYQFVSDQIAPKSTARLYPTKTKFVVKYTPLDLFEKAVHDLRKEELKQKKADELFEKRVKAAEAILTMASMIAGP